VAFKPFEYPELLQYKDAINHSYWLVSEWNFIGDIQDFNVQLTPSEQNAVKNTLLAISQIEVSVKKFWSKLGERFPKAEFDQVGVTFGESEVRHADAYSHLLQVLGLNGDFEKLLHVPAIQQRVDYLTKYLNGAYEHDNEHFSMTLSLFSLFIENISLFSQFAIIKSFNKYRNWLKDIDNVVQATQKEEVIHALFGAKLINIIKEENPLWFNNEFYNQLYVACRKSFEAECNIIDWIFEQGELEFLSSVVLKEFIKNRFNESLELIGARAIFEVNQELVSELEWFNAEIYAEVNVDFFYKRPVTYSKKMQPITGNDLF